MTACHNSYIVAIAIAIDFIYIANMTNCHALMVLSSASVDTFYHDKLSRAHGVIECFCRYFLP